ncbi:MAG: KEOPS complex subunit Pcc1 [Methanobrevibacter sp.]|uniref:KEOPS complex subunit Pcc1 n=1 Tax=Methanobrevibacter sp. TaxID=66852 RepID=UPI0026DF7C54|nr:KEOPS complex subunit Pcc1 [Methanobrevibacter sp.]MDO5848167.1 KEOPS complex subunit Pcc1 [Methanobrevibacter sp.]
MKINGELKLRYNNSRDCETVFKSLEIDNKNFIESEYNENEITYNISSESLGSFLSTVDDLIASEIVVEKIIVSTNDN